LNAEPPVGLDRQLLEDFFAEADEHLLGIRQGILQLESSVGKAQPNPAVVGELFGNFHSFKGISALVGLGSAEAVAHRTEDFLRLMRDGKTQLTEKVLGTLTAATQKLEQIVAAFHSGKPLPGYESLLSEIGEQCGHTSTTETPAKPNRAGPAEEDLTSRIEEARALGKLLWKYTFAPTRELHSAGVDVNSVREQLSKLGQILKATPQVRGKEALTFEFLVAARDAPGDLAAWEAKGVIVEPAESQASDSFVLPAEPPPEEQEQQPFLAPSHIVRVDLKRLDDLMRITGEMVIQRSRLEAQLVQVNGAANRVNLRGVHEVSGGLGRSLRELREAIMRVRLVSVAEIFARMPFVVRDLAKETQKKVRLKLAGQDTAIDKYVIERLKDPLLHLVRNAFSHGVETPAERATAGKPEEATIELSAAAAGGSVIIRVKDDGRGINPNAIFQRAKQLGVEIPATLDDRAILQIICAPGFSTREGADRASGRGIGMTVVNAVVRELGGNLSLDGEEGRGTQFTIRLPLTLAIAETLIITAAGQKCALPQTSVREILHANEGEIQVANGIEIIPYREGILPIVRLAKLFKLASQPRPKQCLLVVSSERGTVGLLAEQVLGQREVVVSALRDPLIQVPGISGATELGDGKPVLILDAAALTAGSVRPPEPEWAM
jgi:two-component system chemotaxis sensor kinase CheA